MHPHSCAGGSTCSCSPLTPFAFVSSSPFSTAHYVNSVSVLPVKPQVDRQSPSCTVVLTVHSSPPTSATVAVQYRL